MEPVEVLEGEVVPKNTFASLSKNEHIKCFGYWTTKDDEYDPISFFEDMNRRLQSLLKSGYKLSEKRLRIIEKNVDENAEIGHATIGWKGYFVKP